MRETPTNHTTDEYGFTTQAGFGTNAWREGTKAMAGWHSTQTLPKANGGELAQDVSFQQVRTHVNTLLKANSNHDKSTRLFLFLKKQANK